MFFTATPISLIKLLPRQFPTTDHSLFRLPCLTKHHQLCFVFLLSIILSIIKVLLLISIPQRYPVQERWTLQQLHISQCTTRLSSTRHSPHCRQSITPLHLTICLKQFLNITLIIQNLERSQIIPPTISFQTIITILPLSGTAPILLLLRLWALLTL